MQAGKSNYHNTLHNLKPDECIFEAQRVIIEILQAIDRGEINPHPRYKWMLNNGLSFINAFWQQSPHKLVILPNSLARMKLTIIQWWHKANMRTSGEILPIELVERMVTDCHQTLTRLLGVPVAPAMPHNQEFEKSPNSDVKTLIYTLKEWITDEREYLIKQDFYHTAAEASKKGKSDRQLAKDALRWGAERQQRAAQMPLKIKESLGRRDPQARFYIGSECPVCGGNKRYRSNGNCYECKQAYNKKYKAALKNLSPACK
ncbi:hypothetical protein NVX01_004570 [Salmonella enterica]|nr:hypothetical protein [Salmonella enterica]